MCRTVTYLGNVKEFLEDIYILKEYLFYLEKAISQEHMDMIYNLWSSMGGTEWLRRSLYRNIVEAILNGKNKTRSKKAILYNISYEYILQDLKDKTFTNELTEYTYFKWSYDNQNRRKVTSDGRVDWIWAEFPKVELISPNLSSHNGKLQYLNTREYIKNTAVINEHTTNKVYKPFKEDGLIPFDILCKYPSPRKKPSKIIYCVGCTISQLDEIIALLLVEQLEINISLKDIWDDNLDIDKSKLVPYIRLNDAWIPPEFLNKYLLSNIDISRFCSPFFEVQKNDKYAKPQIPLIYNTLSGYSI